MYFKIVSFFSFLAFSGLSLAEGAEGAPTTSNLMGSVFPLVLFAVVFYFLLIRPQSKRQKEHRDLVSKLQKGDEVVVAGGILGTIDKVHDQFVVVQVSTGMDMTIQRQAVSQVLPKGTIKSI